MRLESGKSDVLEGYQEEMHQQSRIRYLCRMQKKHLHPAEENLRVKKEHGNNQNTNYTLKKVF